MPKCDFNKVAATLLFNKVAATLLKSHFRMSVLLYMCCIFSEHFFLGTLMGGCF